jgi:hypothetical protein
MPHMVGEYRAANIHLPVDFQNNWNLADRATHDDARPAVSRTLRLTTYSRITFTESEADAAGRRSGGGSIDAGPLTLQELHRSSY